MIKVNVRQREDSCVITIQGHARFAPRGQDTVCSAISTLYQTLRQYVLVDTTAHIESLQAKQDEYTLIITDMENDAKSGLKYFLRGCQKIEEAYPVNVELNID